MSEEILPGVQLGPDHEKKDGTSRLLGCAVLTALMFGCLCAGGALATLIFLVRGS